MPTFTAIFACSCLVCSLLVVLRESTKRADLSVDCYRFDGITGAGSGKRFGEQV
jgi:hypothetical protein